MLPKSLKPAVLVTMAVSSFFVAPAEAQNPTFEFGDLMLYFQQFGGSQTVMVNLGAATTYRDATTNLMNIVNIGGALTGSAGSGGAAYPTNWYDDPSIYWGVAGVLSNSTSTINQVNGDPGRTLYVSVSRTGVGTEGFAESAPWVVGTNGAMTTGANNIGAQNLRMETTSTTTTLVESNASSLIDLYNPFLGSNLGTAFATFPGGVMAGFATGAFGSINGVSAEGALDLNRILATTAPVGTVIEPGEVARTGSYQGTFIISQGGSVSYIAAVPEPATIGLLAGSALLGLARRRRAPRA